MNKSKETNGPSSQSLTSLYTPPWPSEQRFSALAIPSLWLLHCHCPACKSSFLMARRVSIPQAEKSEEHSRFDEEKATNKTSKLYKRRNSTSLHVSTVYYIYTLYTHHMSNCQKWYSVYGHPSHIQSLQGVYKSIMD
jgi:hypothetical protein